jgi:hypothetical protein
VASSKFSLSLGFIPIFSFHIGVKQLLKLVENAKQCEMAERAGQLVNALEELAMDNRDFKEALQ